MSSYTITLKRVAEVYGEDSVKTWFSSYRVSDYLTPEQVDVIGYSPIFKPSYLAEMIYDHYLYSEIAYETPAMFRHFAITKMRELMRNLSSYYLFNLSYI